MKEIKCTIRGTEEDLFSQGSALQDLCINCRCKYKMSTVYSKRKCAGKWELLTVGWIHIASHLLLCPSPSKKGQLFFSVAPSLTVLSLFHAKDRNKDNGKKDIIIIHTELLSLRSG